MDVETCSNTEDQLKELFESTYSSQVSVFEKLNPTTYLVDSEKKYLMKLFPQLSISREQLQTIFSSCQSNAIILNGSVNQSYIVIVHYDDLSSNQQIARFLAQWRLATDHFSKNSLDQDWFNEQYASILQKKKNSFPFLLSNLFTCQQQLSDQLETGLQWTTSKQSSYLMDLTSTFITDINSFPENVKEIVKIYEETVRLSDAELNLLDTFVRLQLVLAINHNDSDDEKQLDLLEQLSSNVFLVRNLVR